MSHVPPRLARALLRLTTPEVDREFLVSDLDEEFEQRVAKGASLRAARVWYWRQVVSSVVPGLLRRLGSIAALLHRDQVAWEIRVGLRRALRRPIFHAVVIATLGVGVATAIAMFSIVDTVLLRPLPYTHTSRLVSVWHRAPGWGFEYLNQTFATFFTYRAENRVFEEMGLWDEVPVTITGRGDPERVRAIAVTSGTLRLLGVKAALGRTFTEADDEPDAPLTVVLDHGYWLRSLGGEPDVVGRTLTVSGRQAEVIGVLPADFRFLSIDADVFYPFQVDPLMLRGVGGFGVQAVARLREGVTREQAIADLDRMVPMAFERYAAGGSFEGAQTLGLGGNLMALEDEVVGDIGTILWVLLAAAGLVLLVTCANVANLFLVQGEGRRVEMAVRTALGGGRARISRQLLLEGLVVGSAGAMVGMLLARFSLVALRSREPWYLPRFEELALRPSAVALAGLLAVVATLAVAAASHRPVAESGVASTLGEAGRSGAGPLRRRVRAALVVAQLALATVLVVGAGLMVRSARELLVVDPGFTEPETLLAFRISVPSAEARDEVAALLLEQILGRVQAVPGVASAGISSSVTMDRWDDNSSIYVRDRPLAAGQSPTPRAVKFVSEGYFETMGNEVLHGRAIAWSDIHQRRRVGVVTENFTREYWAAPQDALGRLIAESESGPWYEIVGVVGDVQDDGLDREPTPVVYWPLVRRTADGRTDAPTSVGFAVRSPRVSEAGFLAEIREAVWDIDPKLAVASAQTGTELISSWLARRTLTLSLLIAAASLAVFLAVIGVYAVVSYMIVSRTREIGLRMALGASKGTLYGMVVRNALLLGAAGSGIGLLGAVGVTRLMSALLYGVSPLDAPTYLVSGVALLAVTILASWIPARRAVDIDPAEALRWN